MPFRCEISELQDVVEPDMAIHVDGLYPTASRFGNSSVGMFRWQRSLFKLVWKQAVVYLIIYVSLTRIYNLLLESNGQASFDANASYFARYTSTLPVVLLLSFYISIMLNRWINEMQLEIPGTNRPISLFIMSLKDDAPDGQARVDRYVRYVLLLWLLNFGNVSGSFWSKFPTLASIQTAGFLHENERRILEKHMDKPGGKKAISLAVYHWLNALLLDTSKRGYFLDPNNFSRNVNAIQALNDGCIKHALENIFALKKVVAFSNYSLGFVTLLGRHFAEKHNLSSIMSGYFPFPYALPYLYYGLFEVCRAAIFSYSDDEADINILDIFEGYIEFAMRLRETFGKKVTPSSLAMNLSYLPQRILSYYNVLFSKNS